jgi:hypothetical protein
MLVPTIKSRPVYGKLMPHPGTAHLMVADGEGAQAVLDMAPVAPAGFFAAAHIIFIPGGREDDAARLRALKPAIVHVAPSIAASLPRLAQCLATARMGLQLYLAGTEGLIGQAMKLAMDHGIAPGAILTEHRGSTARRVQCVHCKGISENVRTQPAPCAHCGLMLFVRDHYSRRIAAFQGVCVDAEEPGSAPPMHEAFP